MMKAAFYDPNPVVILEHKGLYWSKIEGTEGAMSPEPDEEYCIPIGKARTVIEAEQSSLEKGETCGVITYGMGVYWALKAAKEFIGRVEILDLRSLNPLDHDAMNALCQRHGKVLIVTEESIECNFALGLAGRLQRDNFNFLDAAIHIVGSIDTPAIPLNSGLEEVILPNASKVQTAIEKLLNN